jgi:putative transcriptional regulator
MPITNSTAKRIKELRFNLGMTQEQFAAELGVTAGSVRRWETGRNTPSPLAIKGMESLKSGQVNG